MNLFSSTINFPSQEPRFQNLIGSASRLSSCGKYSKAPLEALTVKIKFWIKKTSISKKLLLDRHHTDYIC